MCQVPIYTTLRKSRILSGAAFALRYQGTNNVFYDRISVTLGGGCYPGVFLF